jgi:hypothetical protein
MHELYTAREAIAKLKLPRSTFYYLVDQGLISRVTVPLRKHAYYSRAVIDRLAAEREQVITEYRSTPERLVFMRPSLADLEQLVDIDRTIWGEVGIIDPAAISARFAHNPECVHIVKDLAANKVLAGITMSPLADGLIERLTALQMDESDIQPSDYRPFEPGQPQDCYIVGIVARQDVAEPFYASHVLRHAMDYLAELAERGYILRTLYTVATTEDGVRLACKLGFSEIKDGKGPLGDERRSYRLDLQQQKPTARLVQRYQLAVKNRTRRAKRYQKQPA